MAPKQKTSGAKPPSKYAPPKGHIINRESIQKTWRIRPPQEWLSLLQEIAPANAWFMKGQSTISGKCPYHTDSTPSFTLSFEKGMGKCFGAGCEKVVTDITNLVAKLRNCSYMEALLFIYNRFNLGEVISSSVAEYQQYNQVQEVKKYTAQALSRVIEEIITNDPEQLAYLKPGIAYLVNVRKLPLDTLPLLPVGVWAKPAHLKKYIPAEFHAGYDDYFKSINTSTYYGCLCFYYNDSPGSITRFKLRNKNQDIEAALVKFEDFEKLPVAEQSKLFFKGNSHYVDDPYTSSIGVYGMFRYQSMIGKNDSNAYITEGEFDVLSIMAAQFTSGQIDFMLFGVGGKGGTNIQFLREFGIRTLWLVSDHPSKQGNDWAESILGDKNNFVSQAGVTPLQFRVFQWPAGVRGSDLDEATLQMGYPVMAGFLFRDRNAHFLNSISWITSEVDQKLSICDQKHDQAITLLETTGKERDTELSNIESARKAELQDIILRGFKFVHAVQDRQEYARKYVTDRGIDITVISTVNNAVYALDTMQGVVDRVNSHLKEYFSLAYYDRRAGDTSIFAWSKKNEELVEIPTAERPLLKTIALYVNQEIEQWFDAMLGYNPIYCEGVDEGDSSLSASKKKRQNGRIIVEKAFEQQMGTLQSYDNMVVLSQGVHHLDLPPRLRSAGYIYFVNGRKIFRGQFKDAGDMDWEVINNVVDNGIVFEDIGANRQWSCIEDVTDLYAAATVDLKQVYDSICKILDGWTFKNHTVVADYLAAYIMSLTVMRAISDINITVLTGLSASGKTTFASGLLGGSSVKQHSCPSILESVFQMDDITLAALYQGMEGKSHLVVFDEAETGKGHGGRRTETLEEMIKLSYSMPQAGVVILRGGKQKEDRKEYFMRFPMLLSAITLPGDSTFLSRTVVVHTVKQDNHKSAEQYIEEHFSTEELSTLRKNITVGLIPLIPDIMARRRDLTHRLMPIGRKIANISNRFLDCIATPLAVFELIGGDAEDLFLRMIKCDKTRLEAVHNLDKENDLINTCLYTPCIKISTSDNMTDMVSPKDLILDKEYNILNNSKCGVYYVHTMASLVIVWRQVKFGALAKTYYNTLDVMGLREMGQKNAFVKDTISDVDHQIVQANLGLQDVRSSSAYSIVDLSYLIAGVHSPVEMDDVEIGVEELAPLPDITKAKAPKGKNKAADDSGLPTFLL